MEKEKISRRIEGIEPPIDTNYIKSVMAVKFSRDIADCIPEIDDTTFSDEFKTTNLKVSCMKTSKKSVSLNKMSMEITMALAHLKSMDPT